jgi:hypothetical protein
MKRAADTRPRMNIVKPPQASQQPLPPRVDRDPCPYCGTRADVGCRHSGRAA